MACKNGSCSRNKLGGGNHYLNAAGGAATGASIGGSFGGPIGAGIGTAVGALGGYLAGRKSGRGGGGGNAFTGTEGGVMQSPLLSPQQQAFQNQLIGHAQSQLQNFNDPNARYAGFEPIEQVAKNNFYSETLPTLAERFTALGDSAQNSSAYQNQVLNYGKDFDLGLAALRSQYGQQNQGNQLDLLRTLLGGSMGQNFENSYMKSQPGFGENALSSLLQIAPTFVNAWKNRGADDGGLAKTAQTAFNGEHKKVWDNWISSNSGGRNYNKLF